MNKLYSVHDHWTDIDKKNDVDIESIDGVITGIKVNGEDYGGGGSSDFSTAVVSVVGDGSVDLYCNFIDTDKLGYAPTVNSGKSVNIPIYKNGTIVYIEASGSVSVSGSIVQTDPSYYLISGDCTITIS